MKARTRGLTDRHHRRRADGRWKLSSAIYVTCHVCFCSPCIVLNVSNTLISRRYFQETFCITTISRVLYCKLCIKIGKCTELFYLWSIVPISKAVTGFVYVSKICQKESSIETMSNKAFIKCVLI